MREFIFMLFGALMGIPALIMRLVCVVAERYRFVPVRFVIAQIKDQAEIIHQVFEKRPCSATGGTA